IGTEGPGSPSKVLLGKRKQDNNGDNDGEQSDSMFEAEGQGEADVEMEDQSHTDGDVQEGGSKAEGDSKARVEHAQDECDLGTSASSPIRVGRRWRSKFLCLLSSIRSRLLDQHGIDIDEHVDAPSITALLTSLGEEDQFTRRALSILLLVETGLAVFGRPDTASNAHSGLLSRSDIGRYHEGARDEPDTGEKRKRDESNSEPMTRILKIVDEFLMAPISPSTYVLGPEAQTALGGAAPLFSNSTA
ncbi:hypothetical protein CONPUDRAFT_78518, partial [Coniophora puteana RWD-64-598 SS2]